MFWNSARINRLYSRSVFALRKRKFRPKLIDSARCRCHRTSLYHGAAVPKAPAGASVHALLLRTSVVWGLKQWQFGSTASGLTPGTRFQNVTEPLSRLLARASCRFNWLLEGGLAIRSPL